MALARLQVGDGATASWLVADSTLMSLLWVGNLDSKTAQQFVGAGPADCAGQMTASQQTALQNVLLGRRMKVYGEQSERAASVEVPDTSPPIS